MRARRALAIAITTPFLLATIGMTGASAATEPNPTVEGPITRPDPTAARTGGETDEFSDDETRPEDGVVTRVADQLLGHIAPGKLGNTGFSSPGKS
ncbi:hypothetical protein [Streptomyces cyaneus]|uniref:hypothetical protein n=1 Tax=Streptomyces cyaneus TaxID=1904 RepID=UPI000FF8867D|nr:hypothetical protein [Streptomyces cyaneus]